MTVIRPSDEQAIATGSVWQNYSSGRLVKIEDAWTNATTKVAMVKIRYVSRRTRSMRTSHFINCFRPEKEILHG